MMNDSSEQPRTPEHRSRSVAPEPLPETFEPELAKVDRAVHRAVERERVPDGLGERVFLASRRWLPHPVGRDRLRLTRAGANGPRRRPHAPLRSRFALAASLALACLVAAWFTASSPEFGGERIAGPVEPEPPAAGLAERPRFDDEAWLLLADEDIAYLLETGDLTRAEIESELVRLEELAHSDL